MSLLCLIGRHAGYWSYTNDGSCNQVRFCTRTDCDSTEQRAGHDYQIPPDGRVLYVGDDNCYAKGICTRCGQAGGFVGVVHKRGDWQHDWTDDSEFMAIRFCGHGAVYERKVSGPVDWVS